MENPIVLAVDHHLVSGAAPLYTDLPTATAARVDGQALLSWDQHGTLTLYLYSTFDIGFLQIFDYFNLIRRKTQGTTKILLISQLTGVIGLN